jgi:hypothetical protein
MTEMVMTIAEMIGDMQYRGWNVTFPAFGDTRALKVRATKGDQEWTRGWVATNEGEFEDAIQRLYEEAVGAKWCGR